VYLPALSLPACRSRNLLILLRINISPLAAAENTTFW